LTGDTTVQVLTVTWPSHSQVLQDIRHQVFIQEQQVSQRDEWDEHDALESTQHFVVVTESSEADPQPVRFVATARVLPSGKIGRMAVLPAYRKQGVGRLLLQSIIQYAIRREVRDLYLHAQTRAIPFYEKCGFTIYDDEFYEAGIPHKKMQLALADDAAIEKLFGDQVLRLVDATAFLPHMQLMTKVAIRTIDILSQCLAKGIFDDSQFVEAISELARRSPNSAVRILLRDSKALHGNTHPLVYLSQRISSRVVIRILTEQPQNPNKGYIISDRKRMVYFNDESSLNGFANYYAAAEALHELDEFNRLWESHSVADPNLARLHI